MYSQRIENILKSGIGVRLVIGNSSEVKEGFFLRISSDSSDLAVFLVFRDIEVYKSFRGNFKDEKDFISQFKRLEFKRGNEMGITAFGCKFICIEGSLEEQGRQIDIVKKVLEGDVKVSLFSRPKKTEETEGKKVSSSMKGSCVVILSPKGMNDEGLVQYSRRIDFGSKKELDAFCRKYKNEEDMLTSVYASRYNDVYQLLAPVLTDRFKAYFVYENGEEITDIIYADKKEEMVDYSHMSSDNKRRYLKDTARDDEEGYDGPKWGHGARGPRIKR